MTVKFLMSIKKFIGNLKKLIIKWKIYLIKEMFNSNWF